MVPTAATPTQVVIVVFSLDLVVVTAPPTTPTVVTPPLSVSERARSVQPEGRFTGSVKHFTLATPPNSTLSQAPLSRLYSSPEAQQVYKWLCSYSAGNPSTSSASHNVTRMNFRAVRSDDFDLHLQTLSTKNTQFEHQASSLNLASRDLSIAVQSMDVEVRYWVEESIDFKVVHFLYVKNQSLEDLLLIFKVWGVTCFVNFQLLPRPLFITGAPTSLPNDHYSSLTINIFFLWSPIQRRLLYTAPTEAISCIISEIKTCRMASISVIAVSDELMILKDKKVLYFKFHLVLLCLCTCGSPSRPPNRVSLVISPPLLHFIYTEPRRTVTTNINSRIRVLGSTLSDQGDLMELSSYAVVLTSTASPSSPNCLLHISVRVDMMGCLAKSRHLRPFGYYCARVWIHQNFSLLLHPCVSITIRHLKHRWFFTKSALQSPTHFRELGLSSVTIHYDCQTLIRAIFNKSQIKEIYGVQQDIISFLSYFVSFSFRFIPRFQNRDVNLLVKQTLKVHHCRSSFCFVG
ncbi:uncharacterized protein LOC130497102 [Raphanus sativus]|uniref:Uncharacterized protein LOC130497102 n=1 Tax=Raphanus sativus TaxID=3726 RepID=A0A9W3C371_RAPSA|nr:uncharacterized protein LOC130497102 [Raphanus sativus]XP_056846045.1 uncharacterized protein LOC130497102 [Raphanus sativus]